MTRPANRHGRFQGFVVTKCRRERDGSWRLWLESGAEALVAPDKKTCWALTEGASPAGLASQ